MAEQFTPKSLMERLKNLPAHVVYGQLTNQDWGEGMAKLVPEHMREGFIMYIAFGPALPGRFLSSLLSNDLMGAVGRADDINQACLIDWCTFLYNYAPSECYGSAEKFKRWEGIVKGSEVEEV